MSPAEAFATGIKIESSDQCSFKGPIRRGIMVNNHPTSRGRSPKARMVIVNHKTHYAYAQLYVYSPINWSLFVIGKLTR